MILLRVTLARPDPSPSRNPFVNPTPPRKALQRLTLALTVTALACVMAAGYWYRPLFLGNFDVVDPGMVYRSAQPSGNWEELIREHKLATVLNLRGGSKKDAWFVEETTELKRLHVDYYDVPLSATRRPGRGELLGIVDLLARCRYPLLIHCKSGADRTGLVTSLYLLTRKELPPEQAHQAFSLAHAHIAVFGPERLHEPLHEYELWLKANRRRHTAEGFRAWLATVYTGRHGDAAPLVIEAGVRPRRISRR